MAFWDDLGKLLNPDPTQMLTDVGLIPQQVTPNSPGSTVDTTQADQTNGQLNQLIQMLQGQATTGGGAWEQQLANSTHGAENAAKSLSMGQNGLSNLNREYTGAEGAAAARQAGVGQGNILRAQSQQGAQGLLTNLLGAQGSTDANQAAAQAAAGQGVTELNDALKQQAKSNLTGTAGAAGSALATLSKGGAVPGKPKVFGDDERNDTVKAKLSPGEIVIPRSITEMDDAPAKAAAFVAAVKGQHGGHHGHFADGGDTGLEPTGAGSLTGDQGAQIIGAGANPGRFYETLGAPTPQAPSIQNGGLLDTSGYDANRAARLGIISQLGTGMSAAPQMAGNAVDAAMAGGAHGPAGILAGTKAASEGSGRAAETRANEASRAQMTAGEALANQRAQDLAFAQAAQQAAFRNTELNAGLTLANQAALRSALAGAGQVASAYSTADNTPSEGMATDAEFAQTNDVPDPGLGADPNGGTATDTEFAQEHAHGGLIQRLAGGGEVSEESERRKGQAYVEHLNADMKTNSKPLKPTSMEEEAAVRRSRAPIDPNEMTPSYAEGGGVTDEELPLMSVNTPMVGSLASIDQGQPVRGIPGSTLQGYDMRSPLQKLVAEHPTATRIAGDVLPGLVNPALAIPGAIGADLAVKGASPPLPPGVKAGSKEEKVVEEKSASTPAPQPKAAPVRGGFVGAGSGEESEANKEAIAAAKEMGAAKSEEAKAQAQAYADQQKVLEANAAEQRDTHARGQAAAQSQLAKYEAAQNEVRNIDTTVDPGRFWATRTTGQKILGGIGLALGALGAGPDGINRSVGIINQAIDRDIEAQKSEHMLRLQKGQQAVEGAKNLYAMGHQMFQDDVAANAAAHSTALELAINKMNGILSTSASQQAQIQGKSAIATLKQEKAKWDADLAQRSFDNSIKAQNAQSETMKAEAALGRGQAAAAGKNANLLQGTLSEIDALEKEVKEHPGSPRIGQMRSSILLHMNKLQGGRFNEEINKLNQEVVPGSEGSSIGLRLGEVVAPGLMNNRFDVLRKHIATTSSAPPNPEPVQ